MTQSQDADKIGPKELQDTVDNPTVSPELLQAARQKANSGDFPVESEAELMNRVLWLYLALDNADDILSKPLGDDSQ